MVNELIIFLISAAAIWMAGVWMARSVDAIDTHFKLGSAFGGLILLGISGSLPELAITVTGAMHHDYEIVVGNLLGGIAMQTVVLVVFDFWMKSKKTLSFAASSLILVLEANVVILVVVLAIIATQIPMMVPGTSLSLSSLAILITWILGSWLIYKSRKTLPWKSLAIAATPGRTHEERRMMVNHPHFKNKSWKYSVFIFLITSIIVLIAGVKLEESSSFLANYWGIAAGLFAATFIALITSLPEISTGITSVKMGDYSLAFSDIFGGNAFMPALFIVADFIAGKQILTTASSTDIWFASLGILLTTIYAVGLLIRPKKVFFRLGIDSILVLIIYIAGITALYFAR